MSFELSCLDCEKLVRFVIVAASLIVAAILFVGLIMLEFMRQESNRRGSGR